jgi:hypothetical protein
MLFPFDAVIAFTEVVALNKTQVEKLIAFDPAEDKTTPPLLPVVIFRKYIPIFPLLNAVNPVGNDIDATELTGVPEVKDALAIKLDPDLIYLKLRFVVVPKFEIVGVQD